MRSELIPCTSRLDDDLQNTVTEPCELILDNAWDAVFIIMADYDKWLHFRTTTILKDVSYFEELLRIEETLLSLAETEEIKELVQRRSLLSYKLYELEVQKLFNENLAHFTNNSPSSRHDFLRLRFLHKELRDITSKHRDQRALAALPTTVSEGLIIRAAPVQSPLLALEFSNLSDQAQATARTTIQQIVQQINENLAMTSPKHQAQDNEPPIEQKMNQAQPTTVDGPNFSSAAKNSTDHQGPHSSTMPLVVYIAQNTTIDREADEQPTFSAALEPLATPTLQLMDTTTKTFHTLMDRISSLDMANACIKVDTDITRHHTTLIRDQLTNVVDRLDIKINVLENSISRKLADSQQNFTVLESTMVRIYADSHQQLVDELVLVKSQLVEMVEFIKELSDAKKGENNSRS
ncbi:hypothetical protein F511_12315 [Dorcoceras hygrometricum]|uniref:Uncharacterized protein n=1 Tax=Dorcoceras hygrometricum TaxID=472368 RepID=A0A2Z7DIA7_9LAMI|nr:hypothetical protein F511_12315 [Dorcoceras hygrometricum]